MTWWHGGIGGIGGTYHYINNGALGALGTLCPCHSIIAMDTRHIVHCLGTAPVAPATQNK